MKKFSISFFIMLLLFPFPAFAQDFWEVVPTPDTANLISIKIHNNGDIWLGSNGIYLSQNNGETWEFKGLYGYSIFSIATDSANNIFAGTNSRIFKSTNMGENWDLVFYGGIDNINSLITSNNGIMFASSGFDIGILHSFDYGENWDTCLINLSMWEYIKGFSISPDGLIYAGTTAYAGNGGGVYKSVDTGINWEHIGLYEEGIKCLGFNLNNDLYVGSTGPNWGLYKKDNNDEWELVFNSGTVTGIAVNKNNHIFISCSYAIFIGGAYYSIDYGKTWISINTGLISNDLDDLVISPNQYVFSLCYNWNTLYRSNLPTVSIEDRNTEDYLKAFPDPFYDNLFVTLSHRLNSNIILSIYNINGELMMKEVINPEKKDILKIATKNWRSGLYLISIESKQTSKSLKVIKIS